MSEKRWESTEISLSRNEERERERGRERESKKMRRIKQVNRKYTVGGRGRKGRNEMVVVEDKGKGERKGREEGKGRREGQRDVSQDEGIRTMTCYNDSFLGR